MSTDDLFLMLLLLLLLLVVVVLLLLLSLRLLFLPMLSVTAVVFCRLIFGSRRPPHPPGASNLSHSLDPWPLARLPRVPRVRADVRCGLHVPCGRRASESPLPACLRRQRPAPRLRPPSSLTACRSWSTSSAKWPGGRWWRWRSPPSCRAAGPTHLSDAPPPGRRAGAPASSTFPPR